MVTGWAALPNCKGFLNDVVFVGVEVVKILICSQAVTGYIKLDTFGYIRLWTVTTVAFSKMTFIL